MPLSSRIGRQLPIKVALADAGLEQTGVETIVGRFEAQRGNIVHS